MTEVNARLMTVIGAIKQSIETSGSPGLSVNNHPNAFFLNVIGAIDLAKAAELVLARLEAYEENLKAKFEADVRGLYNKIKAELKAGAVNIEDAMARIKSRAELLVGAGVESAAVAHAEKMASMVAPKGADAETAASAVDGH
jgi:hypothetical protein